MEVSLQPEIINSLKETFNEKITLDRINSSTIYIKIDASLVRNLAEYISIQLKGRFVTCAAIDHRKEKDKFTVIHIFSLDKAKTFLCIKTDLDPSHLYIDSITPIIPGANWAERELRDMSGITSQGHPDLRRLVLADDWPEGEHPLRRDFSFDYKPAPVSGVAPGIKPPLASTTLLPLGSFYAQKEITAYLNLFIYGEKVVDVDYRGFYNHRGLEKMGDSVLNYNQIPFVAERICACCGFSHSTCYCQAIESVSHLEVPPRAQFIRTLLLEIERLYSHSLWLASLCNMEGLIHLFIKCLALQHYILDLSQLLTGNRIIFGMNIIGGLRKDIAMDHQSHLHKLIDRVEKELKTILEPLQGELSLFSRLKGISTLPHSDMQSYCSLGHIARASGLAIDTRVDHPYAAYKSLHIESICRDEGDNLARISLRLDEMIQSLSLIRGTLEKMPKGEVNLKVVEIPPYTDSLSAVESPHGETVHYVLTGENNRPLRWKIKTATFSNLQAIPIMLRGTNIADARITINSIDPCFSCIEH
jgi:Ni,Fe-hydrogenase III large subunit/Ni,Fe-hydrogenase III component G